MDRTVKILLIVLLFVILAVIIGFIIWVILLSNDHTNSLVNKYCHRLYTNKTATDDHHSSKTGKAVTNSGIALEARLYLQSTTQFNPATINSLLSQRLSFKSICVVIPPQLCCSQLVLGILKSGTTAANNQSRLTVVEHNQHCLYPNTSPDISHIVVLDWQVYNHNMTRSIVNHIRNRPVNLPYLYAPIVYQQLVDESTSDNGSGSGNGNTRYRLTGEGVADNLAVPHVRGGYCLPAHLLSEPQLQHKLSSLTKQNCEFMLAQHLYSIGVRTYCIDDVVYQYGRVYLDFAADLNQQPIITIT